MLTINVFNQQTGKDVCFEVTVLYALQNALKYHHNMKNFMIVDLEVVDWYSGHGYTTYECIGIIETDTKEYEIYFELSEAADGYNVHVISINEYERVTDN